MSVGVSRRRLIGGLAAAGVLGGAGALAGCDAGPGGTAPSTSSADAGVLLPSYRAVELVQADLPATSDGVQPGFLSFPAEPKAFFAGKVPGTGGEVSILSIQNRTIGYDGNPYWDELQKRLGVALHAEGVTVDAYPARFATAVAGGQLADAVQVLPDQTARLPELLESKFQDLTPFLAGDAVLDYPGLAALPTRSWESCVYGGRLWTIPLQRSLLKWVGTFRSDLAEQRGLPTQPESGAELLELYRGLTDAKNKQFALAFPMWVLAFVSQCTGAPNGWAEDDGKFVKDYETDQYRQALDITAQLWREGLFHPDSFASSDSQGSNWLWNGVVNGLVLQGSWASQLIALKKINPQADLGWFVPPAWDGGRAKSHAGSGIFSITAIRQGSDDRVREVLRVLDWLAAPFASEESTFLSYGIQGRHWERKDGFPVATPLAEKEVFGSWYISSRQQVAFSAYADPVIREQVVRNQYDAEAGLLPGAVGTATTGLYSDAAQSRSAGLDRQMVSVAGDVITGRSQLAAWDEAVKTWRSNGGDAIRNEYEKAHAAGQ